VFGGDYLAEHRLYRQLFSVELVLFAAAWFQLLKMRARRGHRDAAAPFTGGLALTALTMLLAALPYRIFSKSGGESVVYGNQQCSLVGQRGDDGLLFCPQQHPPWNRIVRLDDVDLHRAGTQESIFAHVTTASKEHR
jgi:hypothetical protein